jgi:dynein heavy chain
MLKSFFRIFKIDIVHNKDDDKNHPPFTIIQKTISGIHELTKSVYERIMHIQNNFQKIITLSSQWNNIPMYMREKSLNRITFGNSMTEIKMARYADMRNASLKIMQLLKENILLFNNVPLSNPNRGK